ncbi:MAG: hypothetical protein ABFD84_07780, partial [Candidatus Polarisedimenticolia bacterium]
MATGAIPSSDLPAASAAAVPSFPCAASAARDDGGGPRPAAGRAAAVPPRSKDAASDGAPFAAPADPAVPGAILEPRPSDPPWLFRLPGRRPPTEREVRLHEAHAVRRRRADDVGVACWSDIDRLAAETARLLARLDRPLARAAARVRAGR